MSSAAKPKGEKKSVLTESHTLGNSEVNPPAIRPTGRRQEEEERAQSGEGGREEDG